MQHSGAIKRSKQTQAVWLRIRLSLCAARFAVQAFREIAVSALAELKLAFVNVQGFDPVSKSGW